MANVRASSKEIKDLLVPFIIGPNEEKKRSNIHSHNKYFEYPTYEQIKDALKVCRRHLEVPFQESLFECEMKSMMLMADIAAYCSENKTKLNLYNRWSLGMASGIIFKGEFYNHTLNVFVIKPKVYFLNSTLNNEIWEGNPDKDALIEIWI